MPNIIVKQSYSHINKAFGNWDTPQGRIVRSRDHYDRIMKEEGYVTYEEIQKQSEKRKLKDYILSPEAKAIIQAAKSSKNAKGKIKLSDKTIDAMVKKGAIGKKIPDYMKLPSNYDKKGGFYSVNS